MSNPFSFLLSLKSLFDDKLQKFTDEIDNVHIVWLDEIQQEANRMFTSDFSAEPELMPKTPSQKRTNRRKRVSLAYQEENRTKRRFSKGKRSKLRGSSVRTLDLITEDESKASTSEVLPEQPKRGTRRNKQTQPEVSVVEMPSDCTEQQVPVQKPEVIDMEMVPLNAESVIETDGSQTHLSSTTPPPNIPIREALVRISSTERHSAEMAMVPEASPSRTATKIAIAHTPPRAERTPVRHSLKLRYSLAGLRHSRTQESVRRSSRRSLLKKKTTKHAGSNVSDDACTDNDEVEESGKVMSSEASLEDDEEVFEEAQASSETEKEKIVVCNERITRAMARNSSSMLSPALTGKLSVAMSNARSECSAKKASGSSQRSLQNGKRKAPETQNDSPVKKRSPVIRPNMRSFFHTVQKNQMLMMTPNSLGRSTVMKSFIKHATPLKMDAKDSKSGVVTRELLKLEALKKKQEQEEGRMKKMEEEKKRKQDEQKRKRDERLRRVVEARLKEEQKEEEKKKRIEQTEKLRVERIAEEKAKKVAVKRQEDLEQKRRLEEEARIKKVQQAEEEKRQQDLRAAEEEERARKLAEARRALELRREREREKELERERQAAAERECAEREKALALQRELERAAREKEKREIEAKRKELEERRKEEQQRLAVEKAAREREAAKQAAANAVSHTVPDIVMQTPSHKAAGLNVTMEVQNSVKKTPVAKGAGLNVTMEVEHSPQSYSITPKGGNKPLVKSTNPDNYGMDQNSDDSTDDESAPRKPIPSWAEGLNLQQSIMKQYFSPPDLHTYFGTIEPPKLENIFYKSKPRYFKRTSSAVWHSPPNIK